MLKCTKGLWKRIQENRKQNKKKNWIPQIKKILHSNVNSQENEKTIYTMKTYLKYRSYKRWLSQIMNNS